MELAAQRHTTASSIWRLTLKVWLWLGGIRVSAFVVLVSLSLSGRLTISALPVVLLLYPEADLIPQGHAWTLWSTLLFTLALLMGSLIGALIIASTLTIARSARKALAKPQD